MELHILHYACHNRILQCMTYTSKETVIFSAAAEATNANCEMVDMADVTVVGFSKAV